MMSDNLDSTMNGHLCCSRCSRRADKLFWCGRCRGTKYCSESCQKADWATHKTICKEEYFDYNKEQNITYRSIVEDRSLRNFLIIAYFHYSSHGWRYLRCDLIGNKKIHCYGSNDDDLAAKKDARCIFVSDKSQFEMTFDDTGRELYLRMKYLFVDNPTVSMLITIKTKTMLFVSEKGEILREDCINF